MRIVSAKLSAGLRVWWGILRLSFVKGEEIAINDLRKKQKHRLPHCFAVL
jgi:hypothetical protein